MRIQHNIMAMNAYRNYNTNTSALSKNLEKLSSGYKINRAGDDAAGLAISEKMRAQITGLNAAQKNVKDGISLVKTSEGAMQEIQDMLNRMDYLATQSANGTYDNEVDRLNLNKEMDALKSEINRIADSANFNGIKLLDGSLDKGAKDAIEGTTSELAIPAAKAGGTLGVDTILHADGTGNGKETEFKVDLSEFKFSGKDGESMTIKVGTNEFKLTANGADIGEKTGADIADAIKKALAGTATTNLDITLNGTAVDATTEVKFNDQKFTVDASGNQLVFKQAAAPTDSTQNVDGKMDVVIGGDGTEAVKAGWKTGVYTAGTLGGGETFDTNQSSAVIKIKVNGTETTFNATTIDGDAAIDDVITALGNADDGAGKKVSDYMDIAKNADGSISFTVKDTQPNGADGKPGTAEMTSFAFTAAASTGVDAGTKAPTMANGTVVNGADKGTSGSGGDYNVQTIEVKNGTAVERGKLASTVVTLTEDMFQDGNEIKIADKTIKVSADKADKNDATKVYIGDMVGDGKTLDLAVLSERLSVAAAGNNAWTVSAHAGKAGITLMEKTNADGTSAADAKWDLTTEKGIKETLGLKTAGQAAVAADETRGLTLQIGDTSDKFNQLKVNVGDMHVNAMGKGKATVDGVEKDITKTIADIDIKTRDNASEAVQVIKNAINYVSGVRGDLGAVQNRLEHTANNLSVMAENIQDAESTIRDTDVAEEMMAYTKNNILIQSAQAMLAQANAVPQGVLQLLG